MPLYRNYLFHAFDHMQSIKALNSNCVFGSILPKTRVAYTNLAVIISMAY